MPSRSGDTPVEQLREVLAARVEATSLRQTAREVGMSPSGLQKFLGGAQPYFATRRKLDRWYVRESARYESDLGAGSAFAALRVLVNDLPPVRRRPALQRLVGVLEDSYSSAGERPRWLIELRVWVDREWEG